MSENQDRRADATAGTNVHHETDDAGDARLRERPKLRELVAEHGGEKESLGDYLLKELYSFVGEGWEQEDDITLLTLRRSKL